MHTHTQIHKHIWSLLFANWEIEQIQIDAGFDGAPLFCFAPFPVCVLLLILWLLGARQSNNNMLGANGFSIQYVLVCSDNNNSWPVKKHFLILQHYNCNLSLLLLQLSKLEHYAAEDSCFFSLQTLWKHYLWKLASSFRGLAYFPQAFAANSPETHWLFPSFSAVSIFPSSILMLEAEASPAETTPLCLTKNSEVQAHAELPSSTTLGQPQSPAALPEEMSGVRKRSLQDSPTYVRSKIKVRKQEERIYTY